MKASNRMIAEKTNWIDTVIVDEVVYPFPIKYKIWEYADVRSEYIMMFRLAEQYLIRAESRAQQGKFNGANSASEDINRIRARAGLSDVFPDDLTSTLNTIVLERKYEFFTEEGHRWYDLKRTNTINEIMMDVAPVKGTVWSSYMSLFPIPVEDIKNNPTLRGKQNDGYPES